MSGAAIDFQYYPASNRTHGVFAEINPQLSGGGQNQRTLILGQMKATGVATAGMPIQATGLNNAKTAFGIGSQLALMYAQYLTQDTFGEVWFLPAAPVAGAVDSTISVTFGGTATAAGTVSLYIAGTLVAVPVAAGTTGAQLAYMVLGAAADMSDLPVFPMVPANNGVVIFTALGYGAAGNEVDIRLNYRGPAAGEITPPGITVNIPTPQMTGGAGIPSTAILSALTFLGNKPFDFIVCPFTDAATLNGLALFLNGATGRWSWSQMLYGHVFTAYRGTLAQLSTFGNSRDEYTASCMGFYDSPSPAWLWAADVGGACATSLRADPGLPLQEIPLNVLAPPIASQFSLGMNNTLLYDGISAYTVSPAGQVITNRMVTFYQNTASGAADITWLNTETPFMVADLTRDMRDYLQTIYARKKLVADGSNIAGGSNQVTSQTVLASALSRYKQYCALGRAQNYALFKQGAQAQNYGGGRVNLLLPFVLNDQLRQIAISVNFIANT